MNTQNTQCAQSYHTMFPVAVQTHYFPSRITQCSQSYHWHNVPSRTKQLCPQSFPREYMYLLRMYQQTFTEFVQCRPNSILFATLESLRTSPIASAVQAIKGVYWYYASPGDPRGRITLYTPLLKQNAAKRRISCVSKLYIPLHGFIEYITPFTCKCMLEPTW